MRIYHAANELYFQRLDNGSVRIIKTEGGPPAGWFDIDPRPLGRIVFEQTLDAGTWVSAVLTMTAFSERALDWHAFWAHHQGQRDLMKTP